MSENDIVVFMYKGGRFVKGKVIKLYPLGFELLLYTDYIGKNEEWDIGTIKSFNINETKELHIIK